MRFNTKHVAVCDILSPIFRFIILLSLPVCCRCWCRGCWQYAFFIRVIPTARGGVWQFAGGPESVIGDLVIVIIIILFWPLPGTRLESTNIILRIIFSVTFSFRLIPNWLLTITSSSASSAVFSWLSSIIMLEMALCCSCSGKREFKIQTISSCNRSHIIPTHSQLTNRQILSISAYRFTKSNAWNILPL